MTRYPTNREILERIGPSSLLDEAQQRGLRLACKRPSTSGWLTCHAIDREDTNPSAGLCVGAGANGALGTYKDHGGVGRSLNFFELLVALAPGEFGDWRAARDYLSDKAGLSVRSKKTSRSVPQIASSKSSDALLTQIQVVDDPAERDAAIEQWAAAKGLSAATVGRANGIICQWPRNASVNNLCVAFPAIDDADRLVGMIMYRVDGDDFPAVRNLRSRKTHLLRGSQDGLVVVGRREDFNTATTIWLCEGVTDALALAQRLPADHVACANVCGAMSVPMHLKAMTRGRQVHVVRDADEPGEAGAATVGSKLVGSASDVRLVRLPYDVTTNHGKDLRDFFAEGRTYSELADIASATDPLTAPPAGIANYERNGHDARAEIQLRDNELAVVDEVIAALSQQPNLFQRGGRLVEIQDSPEPPPQIVRPQGGLRLVAMPKWRLRERITAAARFKKFKPGDEGENLVGASLPQAIVEETLARGYWGDISPIEGIVSASQFLLDGSILSVGGYDAASGLFFDVETGVEFPRVPESPTRQDAELARDELLEVITDFPIDDTGRAGWLAFVLTGVARYAIDGPTPLFAIDANTRGTGKSLLADTVGIIHSGRELARTGWTSDDSEMRKTITSVLLAGEPVVLLDNITGGIGNPALDAVLTARLWTDRILGVSEMTARLPASTIWTVSGNNLHFAADTGRRTLCIRLNSQLEHPEERSDFRHPKLLKWVRQHRGRLAAAAATILRAWHVAGRPAADLPPWGSFEAWSEIIRNAVVWVGLADPGESRQSIQLELDREAMLLRLILSAWHNADPTGNGLTVNQAIKLAQEGHEGLKAVFAELGGPDRPLSPRSVGMKLSRWRQRVCDGMYLERRDTNQGATWFIKSIQSSDTRATSDTNSNLPRTRAPAHAHDGGRRSCH